MRKKDEQFIQTVLQHYDQHGRHYLPWRQTTQPYRIAVSEIMLQQTQVDRVVPKYQAFIRQFPNTKRLAAASLGAVLMAWQGLGYNRRARLLHECAKVVTTERHGRWPTDYAGLCSLPGIGPYTAGAIMAFAYDEAVPLVETNVRTVYLHHFFPTATNVADADILALTASHLTLLPKFEVRPRTWYAALMDYGSHLKNTLGNPNSRAKNYTKQSTFVGSDRQVRGAIIRALVDTPTSRTSLTKQLAHLGSAKLDAQLVSLQTEGLIQKTKHTYHLPE